MKKIFAILLIFALVTGCKKEEVIDYSSSFVGNYQAAGVIYGGINNSAKIGDVFYVLSILPIANNDLNCSLTVTSTLNGGSVTKYNLVQTKSTNKEFIVVDENTVLNGREYKATGFIKWQYFSDGRGLVFDVDFDKSKVYQVFKPQ